MSEASVLTGTVVGGDFRILEPLGSGGMGEVYRAEQLSTGKARALKVMHARLSDDPRQRERFTQEARVAAAVESDHVVEIIAAGVSDDGGVAWIAMELLEGDDLSAYLRRIGPLTPGAATPVLEQLCHALGAAHDAGIVHRDLKPQNVFMTVSRSADRRRIVKVLDFGIAKLIADSTMATTAALGSPAWMAPEQTEASPRISPACDVWSLGLLTFWMLTGRPFWRAANAKDGSLQGVLRELVIEEVPSGSERAEQIGCQALWPAMLDPWLARCLEREPRRRFANAHEAFEGFVAVLEGRPLPELDERRLEAAVPRPRPSDDDAPESVATRRPSELTPARASTAPRDTDTRDLSVEHTPTRRTGGVAELDRTAAPLTSGDAVARERELRSGKWRRFSLALAGLAACGAAVLLWSSRPALVESSAPAARHLGEVVALDPPESQAEPLPAIPGPAPSADTTASPDTAPSADAPATRLDATAAPPVDATEPSRAPEPTRAPVPAAPDARPAPPPQDGDLPPFNASQAQAKIATAQSHAAHACKNLDGPRQFGANLVFHPDGDLEIQGSFDGATGQCVKATLGMARVGAFGKRRSPPHTLPASVTLHAPD